MDTLPVFHICGIGQIICRCWSDFRGWTHTRRFASSRLKSRTPSTFALHLRTKTCKWELSSNFVGYPRARTVPESSMPTLLSWLLSDGLVLSHVARQSWKTGTKCGDCLKHWPTNFILHRWSYPIIVDGHQGFELVCLETRVVGP
jgi:hypothetical protein